MKLELIAYYACKVGEGPLWHPLEKRVYWTDCETGRMFRYDPASGVTGVTRQLNPGRAFWDEPQSVSSLP